MPVKIDSHGRRSVEAKVEVPGTPEEVWRAIATGPGISSWFVPTTVEEREGGAVLANFGPGMDSVSTITAWQPPRRLSAESRDDIGPGDPTIATEWIVEAKAGGTCVVRVVHSWIADSDKWDRQFEGHEQGWLGFFRILRLYLTHFRGAPCAAFQVITIAPGSVAEVWKTMTEGLGIGSAQLHHRVGSTGGGPTLAGVVESAGPPEFPELLIRMDAPTPGLAHLFAMPMGGPVCLALRFYLYGAGAAGVAAAEEPRWQRWLAERFPASAPATTA
jgi:uncharacterized protein YndB with AHSA1/START domain